MSDFYRDADVEGFFYLLKTEEGGRRSPTKSGYRPHHNLHENFMTSGAHEYIETEWLSPGETAKVRVTFLSPAEKSLWVGREIDVGEGEHIVGKLAISKIFNKSMEVRQSQYKPVWIESEREYK